jgi:hypothetical protein
MSARRPSRERPSPRSCIPSFSITRSEAALPGLVCDDLTRPELAERVVDRGTSGLRGDAGPSGGGRDDPADFVLVRSDAPDPGPRVVHVHRGDHSAGLFRDGDPWAESVLMPVLLGECERLLGRDPDPDRRGGVGGCRAAEDEALGLHV